jgi:hypothetical protein
MTDTTDKTHTPRDFTYMGRRRLANGQLADAVKPDGMDTMLFPRTNRSRSMVIGGIYTGAQFSDTGAKGLNDASYAGRKHPDAGDVLQWQALDGQARDDHANAKLERDDQRADAYRTALLPIRQQYHSAVARGDMHMARAIAAAVSRALTTPVREHEK